MKHSLLRIVALLVLLAFVSSCGQGRWARYKTKDHYVHKKHYRKWHNHHNRDW